MKKVTTNNFNKNEKHLTKKKLIPSSDFDYKRHTKYLSKLLKSLCMNEKLDLTAIVQFFSSYTYEQRLILIHGLEYEYNYKLIDMVSIQPMSLVRTCTLAMLMEPIELYVRDFYDLIQSEQIDHNNSDIAKQLLEILLALSNEDTTVFKEIYKKLFKTSVEDNIHLIYGKKSVVSKLFIRILEGNRYEIPAHSMETAKTIARQLYEVRKGTSDIDYDSLIQVFTQDGYPQLSAIFDVYEDKYGRSIKEVIEHQFKCPIEIDCFQDMIDYTRLPSSYYGQILRHALHTVPIDYRTLIRIFVGHQNKDLCEIKLEYSKMYDETVEQTIENRIDTQDIKHIFVTIIQIPNESGKIIRLGRKNKIDLSIVNTIPTAINDMEIKKNHSHEKFEKLANAFKLKRPH